jgi:hypothetical protein
MIRRLAGALAAALIVAGCATSPSGPAGPEPLLGPGGILAGSTGQEISFGRARDGAVTAATKLVGAPPSETIALQECGAGPVQAVVYPGGLTLNFTARGFEGWVAQQGRRSWRSSTGLRTGMSRDEAAALPGARITRSSLGEEIAAGDVFGLIGEDGTVSVLYAGITCFAR